MSEFHARGGGGLLTAACEDWNPPGGYSPTFARRSGEASREQARGRPGVFGRAGTGGGCGRAAGRPGHSLTGAGTGAKSRPGSRVKNHTGAASDRRKPGCTGLTGRRSPGGCAGTAGARSGGIRGCTGAKTTGSGAKRPGRRRHTGAKSRKKPVSGAKNRLTCPKFRTGRDGFARRVYACARTYARARRQARFAHA